MEEFKIRYNITNITVADLKINANRFKARFDDSKNLIEFSQDNINFEIALEYSVLTLPPFFMDKGKIRIIMNELSFKMALGIYS